MDVDIEATNDGEARVAKGVVAAYIAARVDMEIESTGDDIAQEDNTC